MPTMVDRMPTALRHVMANNGEHVANIGHVNYPLKTTVTTINTAGAVTYTPEQLLGGLINRDCNGAGRADVLPTGAVMIAGMPGAFVGQSVDFIIRNTSDAAETITVTAPASGGTLIGTMMIPQYYSGTFRLVVTAIGTAPTYTLYTISLSDTHTP